MSRRPVVAAVARAASCSLTEPATAQRETDAPMTFFVTSQTNSGDLGGLAGADAIFERLATAVGAGVQDTAIALLANERAMEHVLVTPVNV